MTSEGLAPAAAIKSDFLLELLSEEIPARMQARARNDLAKLFADGLAKSGLSHGAIDVWSTPRRLALIARDVPGETAAVREEVKGPRASAPPQALEGFLRKTGLAREELEEREGVFFAVIDRPGRSAVEVLGEVIAQTIRDFPWPKSMRWGAASASMSALRWVRPLHSIVALLGEEIVAVEVEGVTCGAMTLGHRFHHPGPITIGGAHDYATKMRACHVIVDHEEREAIVREGASTLAEGAGYSLVEDEGLVVENAGLTEWPVPLLGTFDADYLDVPPEVIQLTARTNQKYFVMRGSEGQLAPAFVCTANIEASGGGGAIVEGNQRVLAARLSDARFFWEQDVKVPLTTFAGKLIQYQEKLGSFVEKTARIVKVAEWLVANSTIRYSFDGTQEELARLATRAANLTLLDQPTQMVGEFPELEGIMGGYYAKNQGEDARVVDAVTTQYKPKGSQDVVPTKPLSVLQAMAFKTETRVAFAIGGIKPTGSKDPYGVRRTEIGLIRLIVLNGVRVNLGALLQAPFPDAAEFGVHEVLSSILDRLKAQQRDEGVRHDLIDAVFALGGEDDLVRLLARVRALQAFVETSDGADLLAGYKRAANILKKEEGSWAPEEGRGVDVVAEEASLTKALDIAEPRVVSAIEIEDFTRAMTALASLRAPIDAFFEAVTVNDTDPAVRARRLNLLARFRDAVHRVADFSKIEG